MTHRYRRYADKVGIRSSLKELRHYSATQLLASGVDLNTVAGRLGHAEGSTTLKFYAQFSRPADQHAAAVIPPSSTGSARRNGSANSTVSTFRCPAPMGSPPSPRSSVLRPGLTNIPLLRGLQSSHPRTEHLGVNRVWSSSWPGHFDRGPGPWVPQIRLAPGTRNCARDRAAIRHLLKAHRQASARGGQVRFAIRPGSPLHRITDFADIHPLLAVYPTVQHAITGRSPKPSRRSRPPSCHRHL